MAGSFLRLWRDLRCWKDKLVLGNLARCRAALTPSQSVFAAFWSNLRAMASVAEIISSWEMCLGATANESPSARTSSSTVVRGLELRFTTSLLWLREVWGIAWLSLLCCLGCCWQPCYQCCRCLNRTCQNVASGRLQMLTVSECCRCRWPSVSL